MHNTHDRRHRFTTVTSPFYARRRISRVFPLRSHFTSRLFPATVVAFYESFPGIQHSIAPKPYCELGITGNRNRNELPSPPRPSVALSRAPTEGGRALLIIKMYRVSSSQTYLDTSRTISSKLTRRLRRPLFSKHATRFNEIHSNRLKAETNKGGHTVFSSWGSNKNTSKPNKLQ